MVIWGNFGDGALDDSAQKVYIDFR